MAQVWLSHLRDDLTLNDVRDWLRLVVGFYRARHNAFDPSSLLTLPGATGRLDRLCRVGVLRRTPAGVCVPLDADFHGKGTRRVPLLLTLCERLIKSQSSAVIGVGLGIAVATSWLEKLVVTIRPVRLTIQRLVRWAGVKYRAVQLALEELALGGHVDTKDTPSQDQNQRGQMMRVAPFAPPPKRIHKTSPISKNQEGRGVSIERADLQTPSGVRRLWERFVKAGWVQRSEDGLQCFKATAQACLRVGIRPAALLVHRAKRGLWDWAGGRDELAAARLGAPKGAPQRSERRVAKIPLTADARTLLSAKTVAQRRGLTFGAVMVKACLGWDQDRYEVALGAAAGAMR